MASFNYTLKYRTFQQALDDVLVDFKSMNLENKIEPAQMIRVVMRVNYDLGLRVNMTKEVIVNIEHGRGKLPDEFYVMNFALLCGQYTVCSILPQGTNIQEVPYPRYTETLPVVDRCGPTTVNCSTCNTLPCCCQSAACITPQDCNTFPTPVFSSDQPYGDPCIKPRVYLDCKGNSWELIQMLNTETRTYKFLQKVRFKKSQFVDCDCPNINTLCNDEAYIRDGYIWTNLKTANMYINYQGALEDEEGNLLVPDQPMLNEYYEYALKERILETLAFEGENVGPQLQLVIAKLRMARNNALTIVNTPNFSEMQQVWALNRKAMYSKYYSMFQSYFGPHNYRLSNII